MNYATQKTSHTTRFTAALLSVTVTVVVTFSIVWGMAGGTDSASQMQMAAKKVPQVVAQR